MRVNSLNAGYHSFREDFLPALQRREIALIGIKSLGGNAEMIKKKALTVEEALRYTLSLPIATPVSGIDSLGVLRQNLGIVRDFKPMTRDQMAALEQRCSNYASDGRFELYKSSKKFDGPPGRAQHGLPEQKQMED